MKEKYFLKILNYLFILIILFIINLTIFCYCYENKTNESNLLDYSSTIYNKVFKFIRQNEKICGNIYLNNTNWLPAFHNCQLKCRIDSEICQMSGPIVRIRKQRCFELPLECRRNLKKFLGGAELFTKPNYRIWRNIVSSNLDKKVKMENKQNNSSKKLIKNLKNNLINENKNINYLPLKEEFLLPLSQDNDILIPVDLLFNTKQQILKNKKKNNIKQISTKLLLNTLSTPITPTTLKITQKHVNNIKNKIQQNYFELNNTENKIISNKFNNSSNLQRSEIFGPPIKSSNISHHQQLISKDSFIYQQQKQFQNQNIIKEKKQINDLKFKLIPPWWTFKKINIKNDIEKKSKIEKDFTNQCCQWALNGLCDRSWQRIRELCPKSCGNILCSSFEGTLSCSRVLDVDVIGCYERRQQPLLPYSIITSNNFNSQQIFSTTTIMTFLKGKDDKINEEKIINGNESIFKTILKKK